MFKSIGAIRSLASGVPGEEGGGSRKKAPQESAYIEGEQPKRKKKKPKKKKYKDGDSSDGERKRLKIKKMRMRAFGGSKRSKRSNRSLRGVDSGDDSDMESRGIDSPSPMRGNTEYGMDQGFEVDEIPQQEVEIKRLQVHDEDANRRFRVKPYHAFDAPYYMNETELYNNMMEPSDEFEFLTSYLNPSGKLTRKARVPEVVRRHFGSPKEDGRVGSLRVEVLGCVGLDRAKPEISVYLIAGDCAFTTDIITGARSPMWPASSKRAAVFPLHHAYAKLFVGVFDVKQRKNSEADVFCGRVAIDMPPLRPDTEFDITLPLRASSFIYDRRPRGVVRLRFSLHWFSERAAIMSYLNRPRNPLAFSKQAQKQPTIPCGDPKTFRNVAVTVHGLDFPGKYTRGAFRATMREFNLYQQNIRFLTKVTILDCILYENPLMSLYLFGCSMYCVWLNSVRYVPPFFTGWLIYLFLENYWTNCGTVPGHLGYKPLTISEMFYGLVRDGRDKKFNFKPILVKKRARKQVTTEEGKIQDIELMNHREFPFSERFEYHKFAAADAIAPSPASKGKGKGKGTDLRTERRLSIYVAPVGEQQEESESSESDDESEVHHDDREDEGVMDQADDGYGNMQDSDEEQEDDDENQDKKGRIFQAGKASATRRIRVGPPQNSESSGRKVPPQVHLSRVEHMLHRATKNISVEHVHFPPPHLQMNMGKEYNQKGPASDVISAKEKQNFDEFDRLLGFRQKNPNPILRITSSFLGPLMRIVRIVIYATRIGFNVTSWTDPFLTFWVFTFLCTLTFVLLIFPWRTFFFLSALVLLGPQNIFVRKYLERRAKEKEQEEKEKAEQEKLKEATQNAADQQIQQPAAAADDKSVVSTQSSSKKKKFWGRSRKDKAEENEEEVNEADLYHSPRPAFYAHTRPSRRTQVPRDVAVPYFRFRKDRFYDWPPDPTVSRATPLLTSADVEFDDLDGGSKHHSKKKKRDDDEDIDDFYEEDRPRGVRRRANKKKERDEYGY